jgi:L,D-transpeptidase catalytic domain
MNSVTRSSLALPTAHLWQVALVTAAGVLGVISPAGAASYYWTDYSDGSYGARQDRHPEVLRPKPQKRSGAAKKNVLVEKEAGTKPQGPLVIVVSIDRQQVTVYDSNGVFAESPVSTGMKGHSTPMGVFSVIQKHKFHHSNIYSGAPMPYMQRITWSGVAMHAGVLPGYPASHGCIRMPMAFAMKMWNWTKMGARVIVVPGQISPQTFSHPVLATMRVPPQPSVSADPKGNVSSNVGDKADKGATESKNAVSLDSRPTETRTASADDALELRASVGHTVMSDATIGNAPARAETGTVEAQAETRTAEAAGAGKPEVNGAAGASADAKPAEAADALTAAPAAEGRPSETAETKTATTISEPAKAEVAKPVIATSETAKSDTVEAAKKADITAATPIAAPEPRKDESRVPEPAPAPKADAPKRAGQIAVFISRKDSKLYVRQNFAPLFDVPVAIASDRPLGTHVFTAEIDKTDANALRWSVVSLPVSVRSAEREDDGRLSRRARSAAIVPVAARPVVTPDGPAEALDRIAIPADALSRINEMLTTGGSIVVSDQGINQGETGEGTDFIIRLR